MPTDKTTEDTDSLPISPFIVVSSEQQVNINHVTAIKQKENGKETLGLSTGQKIECDDYESLMKDIGWRFREPKDGSPKN